MRLDLRNKTVRRVKAANPQLFSVKVSGKSEFRSSSSEESEEVAGLYYQWFSRFS